MVVRMLALLVPIALSVFAPTQAQQNVVVHCESVGGRQQYCQVETRYGVRLVEEFSRGVCREGGTWGHDARGIWVSHGCRAAFELGAGDDGYAGDTRGRDDRYDRYDRDSRRDDYDRDGGYDYAGAGGTILCESKDNRRRYCRADVRGGQVVIVRNISRASCDEGYGWGYDDGGVWVDQGCRAEFAVEPLGRYGGRGSQRRRGSGEVISCESKDFRRTICGIGRARDVVLLEQTSEAACIEGRTWGFDGRGVWVDRGCAGDFAVTR